MRVAGRWLVGYSLLAGLCDTATGVLLMLNPEWTLHLMRISEAPSEWVFLRFVGAFVAGVGLSYLYGSALAAGLGHWQKLQVVWELTALVRMVIFTFTTVSIVRGELPLQWVSVPICDGLMATWQIGFCVTDGFGRVTSSKGGR